MEKEMSTRVNYDDFIVNKNKAKSVRTYVTWGLKETDKDAPDVIGLVVVNPDTGKSFFLKRCVGNHFFNPHDYQPHTKSDIAFKDHKSEPEWVKVSFTCYSKYLEFLKGGSRVALSKAEREYLSE
jgi:hypothetical protein